MKFRIFVSAAVLTLGVLTLHLCAGAEEPPIPEGVHIDRILVDKSDRTLSAYEGDRLVATYRAATGIGSPGPKVYEGDRRTPEGHYRIRSRHVSRAYHRFLLVSYPNAEDRRRYRDARARGEVPEGAGIGGDIGIHGEPRAFTGMGVNALNWTAGCIAVDDAVITSLYRAVVEDCELEIRP